jgi:anti-sigma factor RsiW
MDCGYREKIILCFYGELPAGVSAEVQAHLETCRSCSADLSVLKGLSEGLGAFQPRPPELDTEALAAGFRGAPADRLFRGFMRRALVGALAAVFLAAFYVPGLKVAPSGWQSGIDAGLENVESRIYTLEDEILCAVSADFDYAYSDLETQKEQADERA